MPLLFVQLVIIIVLSVRPICLINSVPVPFALCDGCGRLPPFKCPVDTTASYGRISMSVVLPSSLLRKAGAIEQWRPEAARS